MLMVSLRPVSTEELPSNSKDGTDPNVDPYVYEVCNACKESVVSSQ